MCVRSLSGLLAGENRTRRGFPWQGLDEVDRIAAERVPGTDKGSRATPAVTTLAAHWDHETLGEAL